MLLETDVSNNTQVTYTQTPAVYGDLVSQRKSTSCALTSPSIDAPISGTVERASQSSWTIFLCSYCNGHGKHRLSACPSRACEATVIVLYRFVIDRSDCGNDSGRDTGSSGTH